MKISEIVPLLTQAQVVNDTVLMTGVHGIGKSDVVKQWARENNVHLEILFLSNQEVGDLVGIPHNIEVDGKVIERWSVPSWLDRLNEANKAGIKTALFLDEISRAPADVKQCALQLVLDKKIHEHKLPSLGDNDTLIIAADNPDNGYYQVEPMDPALLDRFLSVEVEVDVETWLDWARAHKINKVVCAFISDNPSKLHFIPEDGEIGENVSATPRSWSMLSRYIDNFNNVDNNIKYPIIAGKVGKAIAAQFINFLDNYKSIISAKDIEDLTNELLQKTKNIEKIGDAVKELTSESETIQLTEIALTLVNKYIDNKPQDAYPLLALMYGLNIEVLVSVLKKISSDSKDNYKKLVAMDVEINNKQLFTRAAKAIVI